MRVKFEAAVRRAQDDICKAVSELDGKPFHEDAWVRPGGGGGVSRVLQVVLLFRCYLRTPWASLHAMLTTDLYSVMCVCVCRVAMCGRRLE